MPADDLHRTLYVPDLLVNALNQDPERPLLHLLDGPTLNVGQVRDAASRFVQALQGLGITAGTRVGLLSANRPEVLHVANAVQVLAAIYVPMHPLSGLADHLHVVVDAGVDILIFDAQRYRRTRGGVGAAGAGSAARGVWRKATLAEDLCEMAERYTPAPSRRAASRTSRRHASGLFRRHDG